MCKLGYPWGNCAGHNDHAVAIADHHITRLHKYATHDHGTIHGLDLVAAWTNATAYSAQVKRDLLRGDLVRIAR
jgi:hypothetical protein